MNLTEFIRKNDIRCKDGQEFDHSPEFYKIREFERACLMINGVPFLLPETYEVKEFDVMLTGFVQEKWDKREKKTRRRFFVLRYFKYPDMPEELGTIEDAVEAGKTIEEALDMLAAEQERFEFFKRYDLIDTGRYWLNRDLRRCLVDDGQVIVMGG